MGELPQLGIGGILALLIVREVLQFLKERSKRETADNSSARTITAGNQSTDFYTRIFDRLEAKIDRNGEKLDELLERK